MSDFAKNLRALRKERGLSQTELANVLGYGYTAISNYEKGRNEPTVGVLIALAEYFEVSVDELLGTKRFYENKKTFQMFCDLNMRQREKVLELIRSFQKDNAVF